MQLKVASQSQPFLLRDLNYPGTCWNIYAARQAPSRRLQDCTDDNFLMQMVKPTRKGAQLDLVLTNKEGLVKDMKVGGRLGCSDQEMVEFMIMCSGPRPISKNTDLEFGKANFGLIKELLGKIPWDRTIEGMKAQEHWLIFKHHVLQ